MELDSSCFRKQKFYSKEEKGIVLNNECKSDGSFLFSDKSISDTICISKLKRYNISSMENIKSIEKQFRLNAAINALSLLCNKFIHKGTFKCSLP